VITKAVDEASNGRASIAELSKSNSKLYHGSSLSLVFSSSEELGGEESSD
jgi:hypothetical protein